MPAPVKSLLNYPDVVKKMNDDLDWTTSLGTAVTAQQKDVLEAIQRFRRKVYSAGNLKTDDKQVVVVEKETIKVVQADPQVIYVPQYQPAQVVVVQSAPVYAYYPTPYPVYYYPYPPGAAFATGLIIGVATANAFNWNNSTINYNVNVNELQQNRANYANAAREDRQVQSQANQSQRQGQSSQNQTQRQESISSTTGANQSQRQRGHSGSANAAPGGGIRAPAKRAGAAVQRPETATQRQQGAAAAQAVSTIDRLQPEWTQAPMLHAAARVARRKPQRGRRWWRWRWRWRWRQRTGVEEIEMNKPANTGTRILSALSCAAASVLAAASFPAAAQQVFTSPDAAVSALIIATKSNDEAGIREIFGPKSLDVLGTVDKARDRDFRSQFAAFATEYRRLDTNDDGN
jgi:hypothetical protein